MKIVTGKDSMGGRHLCNRNSATLKPTRCVLLLSWLAILALGFPEATQAQETVVLPQEKYVGAMELVATFAGPMPTGVTVSHSRRIFVNFPRWGDKVEYTVAELRGNKTVPFPPGFKQGLEGKEPKQEDALVSVQSVVVDTRDRLWILDTGSPMFAPTSYGGPKLIGVDLTTNKIGSLTNSVVRF